jgi:hypothetical protein
VCAARMTIDGMACQAVRPPPKERALPARTTEEEVLAAPVIAGRRTFPLSRRKSVPKGGRWLI